MKDEHFAMLIDTMERFSITGHSDDSRKVMSIQDKLNFPLSASRSQSMKWNEAFHSRWKDRIKFQIRGRV